MTGPVKYAPPLEYHSRTDPVVANLQSLSRWQCRLFLAKRVQPRYPHFQYKYKALATNVDDPRTQHLRDIVVESRLWLSSPREFNDPFDMTARVILEGETQELRQRFKQLIADKSGKPWKERRAMLDQFMARPRDEWQATIQRVHEENFKNTGVFSFAGDPRNIAMWAYYGEQHTGVCLQFEVSRDPRVLLSAIPVNYVTDYPVFNWNDDTAKQHAKTLTNKFEAWKHEEESRIVWPGGAHTYVAFEPAALVGLIYGCRTDVAAVEVVQAILQERRARGLPEVRTYRAEKHERKYALRIRRSVGNGT